MLRRSGASDIRIVRAEDEAAARAQLAAAGLDPVSVEAIGPSLIDSLGERIRSGGWRLPRRKLAWPAPFRDIRFPDRLPALLLILATIPFTTAIGAWTLTGIERWRSAALAEREAAAIRRAMGAALAEQARGSAEAAMAIPSLGSLAARLRTHLPAEAGLSAMALDERGVFLVEIETPDPDRLRSAFAADPLLGSLREVGQARTGGGTIRVSLNGRIG